MDKKVIQGNVIKQESNRGLALHRPDDGWWNVAGGWKAA